MSGTRPTRFAVDLLESASVEGTRESRSARQQLDYWARVGRAVSMHQSAPQRQIQAALADTTLLARLDTDERLVANARIDSAIQQHAQSTSYGDLIAAEGVAVVALDEDGRIVRFEADGTSAVIG